MPTGKITAYLDCVSPFSYFALVHLEKHRATLESHNVEIDIVPVFLGGIMQGSVGAKAAYSTPETARAKRYFDIPTLETPPFFPILSLLPQRALVVIKAAYPELHILTFLDIFAALWEGGKDVSKPDVLSAVLLKRFEEQQVRDILAKAGTPDCKQALNENTKAALEQGAFGCPWFWVQNSKGEGEPFFGSDRFHYIWEYLGLPWKDVELLPAPHAKL